MEFFLSGFFIIVFIIYVKWQEGSASNYCNTHEIDWKKANEDKTMHGLSNMEVNANIKSGKYNKSH